MRTPINTIQLCQRINLEKVTLLVIETVDKKAYLSALATARKYYLLHAIQASMISEAALTGKPIYIARYFT